MAARRCNLNLLDDTVKTYDGVRTSLRPPARATISKFIQQAKHAAGSGNCADMHRYAQTARGVLERSLDNLLGRR